MLLIFGGSCVFCSIRECVVRRLLFVVFAIAVTGCVSTEGLLKEGYEPVDGDHLAGKTVKFIKPTRNFYLGRAGHLKYQIVEGDRSTTLPQNWEYFPKGFCHVFNEGTAKALDNSKVCYTIYVRANDCKVQLSSHNWTDCKIVKGEKLDKRARR